MPILVVETAGNQLLVRFADTSNQLLYPTGQGMWLPGSGVGGPPGGSTGDTGGSNGGSGTVAAPVNDYPFPNGPIGSYSSLGFGYRECVDFTAWRVNRDKGSTAAPWKYPYSALRPSGGNGDAVGWRGNWLIRGWAVDLAPQPGMIAWINANPNATLGHVAYVQAVSGSNVVVEDYDWGGAHSYGTRTLAASTFDSFLQAPPA